MIPEPEKQYSLVGEWKWESSCGGYDGYCYTPENTGDTLCITFTKNDTIIIVENSDTLLQDDFSVRKGKGNNYITPEEKDIIYIHTDTAFITEAGYFIIAPETFNHFIVVSLNDTLHLEEDVCDGFGYIFTRKQERRHN